MAKRRVVDNKKSFYNMKSNVVKIAEVFGSNIEDIAKNSAWGGVERIMVDSSTLLKIKTLITPDNMKMRGNAAPPLDKFFDLAEKCPDVKFKTYIVSPERIDCRFDIEGVLINMKDFEIAHEILSIEHYMPDKQKVENGIVYWWWD